jgi:hypothetical protein
VFQSEYDVLKISRQKPKVQFNYPAQQTNQIPKYFMVGPQSPSIKQKTPLAPPVLALNSSNSGSSRSQLTYRDLNCEYTLDKELMEDLNSLRKD